MVKSLIFEDVHSRPGCHGRNPAQIKRRRPYGPRYVTGAVLACRRTKMLGTQSERDNTESLFQPRQHTRPSYQPVCLRCTPFQGCMPANLGCLGGGDGRGEEGEKDGIEKPWNRTPPRNTHNHLVLLLLFQCCCPVDALPDLLHSEVSLFLSLSVDLVLPLFARRSACDSNRVVLRPPSCLGLVMF